MATDSANPGVPQSNLGSLSQGARQKQLNQARGILFFVGILTVAVNGFLITQAPRMVDDAIRAEIAALGRQGMVVDQTKLAEVRQSAIRATQLVQGVAIALGALFIVFGFIVKKFPVPITIVSLVLYVGAAAVFGILDPSSLAKGALIKILIVVALAKSIQAALAYQRESDRAAAAGLAS